MQLIFAREIRLPDLRGYEKVGCPNLGKRLLQPNLQDFRPRPPLLIQRVILAGDLAVAVNEVFTPTQVVLNFARLPEMLVVERFMHLVADRAILRAIHRRTIARWQVFWREQIPRSARPRPAENSLNGYCQAQAVVAYTNASAVLNAKLSDKFFKRGSNLNGYLKPHFWIVLILNAYSESLFV